MRVQNDTCSLCLERIAQTPCAGAQEDMQWQFVDTATAMLQEACRCTFWRMCPCQDDHTPIHRLRFGSGAGNVLLQLTSLRPHLIFMPADACFAKQAKA